MFSLCWVLRYPSLWVCLLGYWLGSSELHVGSGKRLEAPVPVLVTLSWLYVSLFGAASPLVGLGL